MRGRLCYSGVMQFFIAGCCSVPARCIDHRCARHHRTSRESRNTCRGDCQQAIPPAASVVHDCEMQHTQRRRRPALKNFNDQLASLLLNRRQASEPVRPPRQCPAEKRGFCGSTRPRTGRAYPVWIKLRIGAPWGLCAGSVASRVRSGGLHRRSARSCTSMTNSTSNPNVS